jgi:hypothetical protein
MQDYTFKVYTENPTPAKVVETVQAPTLKQALSALREKVRQAANAGK